MLVLEWLAAMSLLAATATPAEKVQSRARPGVPRYTIEQLFATRTIGDAAWAPDGERVVFVSNITGRNNLWLVPASGGWPTQLTTSDQRQSAPAWSPDGYWIAFQSDHDADEQWDLFLVRCPPEESQQVVDALEKSGRRCEFLLYADEGHGFARLENLFDAYRRIVTFFDGEWKGPPR